MRWTRDSREAGPAGDAAYVTTRTADPASTAAARMRRAVKDFIVVLPWRELLRAIGLRRNRFALPTLRVYGAKPQGAHVTRPAAPSLHADRLRRSKRRARRSRAHAPASVSRAACSFRCLRAARPGHPDAHREKNLRWCGF